MTTKQLQQFLLWLRKERIAYSSISIGGLTLDGVIDGNALADAKPEKSEPQPTMWQRYGAELLNKPATAVDDVPDEAKIDD